jgi:hypothetical protein
LTLGWQPHAAHTRAGVEAAPAGQAAAPAPGLPASFNTDRPQAGLEAMAS